MSFRALSESAYVVGVGNTPYRKRHAVPATALALEAVLSAINDAGLEPDDIDGIVAYPGHVGSDVLMANLGLSNVKWRITVDLGGAAAVSSLASAALAVLGGQCSNVLIYRALKGNSGLRKAQRPSWLPAQELRQQLEHPHGWNTPSQRFSVLCQHYSNLYGEPRDAMAEVALAARSHAQLNPDAQMHDRPLTRSDYDDARMIAGLYRLFDCCLETDGACALIVSNMDRKSDRSGRRSVEILDAAEGHGASPEDISNRDPFLSVGLEAAAHQVWNRSTLAPSDMDAAMIYDCFTFEVIHQLEAAGFCAEGNGPDFVMGGRIRLGGQLPVNTHGGLLSEGHMVGLNHVAEAVRQLRGEAGPRQVPDARHIAVTGWGQLGDGSLAVLGAK